MKKFSRFLFAGLSLASGGHVWSSSLLGTVDGFIGGGTFTTSSEVPTGIYFGYGYGGFGGIYVFDEILITGGGETELFPGDDSEFLDIVNALTYGTPGGESFFATLGIAPFSTKSSYHPALPIQISAGSIIESLVLTIDDFSFISTPSPGGETLWEIDVTGYSISAYGTVPLPASILLFATGIAGLFGTRLLTKKT